MYRTYNRYKRNPKRYAPSRYRRRATNDGNYSSYAYTALKALRLASHVASIVNSELKHYDEVNTLNPDSTTGASTSIIRGMAQGDSNVSFQGNSILVKKVQFNISFLMNASATSSRVRLIAVWDTRPSTTLATIPAWTDVQSAANITSFMNIDDQLNRFKILFDRRVTVDSTYSEKQVQIFRKVSRHIKFTDAQVPNLNDIIILAFSDEATNTPTITVRSRIRFYDN